MIRLTVCDLKRSAPGLAPLPESQFDMNRLAVQIFLDDRNLHNGRKLDSFLNFS